MEKKIEIKDCQKGKILMIMEEYFEPTGCTNCKYWNGDDEGFGSNDCLLKEKGEDCCYYSNKGRTRKNKNSGLSVCFMKGIRTNPNSPMTRMDVARFFVILRRSLKRNYTKRQRQRLEERQAEIDSIYEIISKNNEEEKRVTD